MAKTVIDLDEEALALAAEALGTKTKKDTVNAALADIGARLKRERALQDLIALDEEGAFEEIRELGYAERVWQ
ncbi:type II toxin-antitoxin system VapB family antitoxin [Streptomyces sp. KLOTTS4A1]|uniref:type II toxin-antitoxin system VapB family antitoxin n=1 Tax=Streptomyces sp. KLOTTS4A1 TaxID=3390996 RepID=UPI0039F507EA